MTRAHGDTRLSEPAAQGDGGHALTTAEALVTAMNSELRAADPGLVGNDDLLRGVLAGCGDCIKVLDLEGRLQFMSDGGKRVMEVEDFSVLKGCPWHRSGSVKATSRPQTP